MGKKANKKTELEKTALLLEDQKHGQTPTTLSCAMPIDPIKSLLVAK